MALTTRFYVTPAVGNGRDDPIRPQWFINSDGLSEHSGAVVCPDYGQEPTFFVTAQLTDEEHALVIQHPEVLEVADPTTLDNALGQDVARLQPRLEAFGFPAAWLEPSTTYRDLIRHLLRCVSLAQRMQLFGPLFPPGYTLASTLAELPPGHRRLMRNAVATAGGTDERLQDAMTMRDAIKALADQLPAPTTVLDVVL